MVFITLNWFPFYCQVTVPSNCAKEAVLLYSIPECNKNAYELVFEDNFNGNALDTSKWELPGSMQTALLGASHIDYTTLDNIYVSNGICLITARKETVIRRVSLGLDSNFIMSDGLSNLRKFDFTSGGMWTKSDFFHGKFEVRCRMPVGKGFWPGTWLYGGKRGNELDIIDNYIGTSKWVTNVLHDYDGNEKLFACQESFSGFDFTKWHTFSCIFDFDKISFLLDDKLVRVIHRIVSLNGQPINCGDEISSGTYFFVKGYPIERMHLILNLSLLSVNGPPGSMAIDGTTPFPSAFEIDYVKVWKKASEALTLSLSPNPVIENLKIESNHQIISVRIYDVSGRILYDKNACVSEINIDLRTLVDGVYFVTAVFENGTKTNKIVKVSL